MKPFTFDQWWYDYRIKFGLKDSREVVAMAAWQAAQANMPDGRNGWASEIAAICELDGCCQLRPQLPQPEGGK